MKKLISIIAPMYNEELLVEIFCNEVFKVLNTVSSSYDTEIVLVNDGSSDSTLKKMLETQNHHLDKISVINLSRNFGLEGAINAGLTKANGDLVVVMDADLQDPPIIILKMLEKHEAGADVIIAARRRRESDSIFKKVTAFFYYKFSLKLANKLYLVDNAANYRMLSRNAVNKINLLPEVNRVFRIIVPYIGLKTEVVEYDRDKRYAGKTKYNISSMLEYGLNSITSTSVSPLRKTFIGLQISIFIFISAFISLFFLIDYNYFVISSILLIVSFFSSMIFFFLSIISEYIAQIVIEVKRRPNNIIYNYYPAKKNLT
jgi:dolichol-phosphate mannosyltransferase